MSRYSHLPIYISAMDLLRELYKRVPKFNKQYKYFLGGELMKYSTKIVSLIMDINNEKDKEERISLVNNLDSNIEMLMVHTRISHDLKQLGSDDSYMFLSEKMVNLSKQTEGWKKYLQKVDYSQNLQS